MQAKTLAASDLWLRVDKCFIENRCKMANKEFGEEFCAGDIEFEGEVAQLLKSV